MDVTKDEQASVREQDETRFTSVSNPRRVRL